MAFSFPVFALYPLEAPLYLYPCPSPHVTPHRLAMVVGDGEETMAEPQRPLALLTSTPHDFLLQPGAHRPTGALLTR